MKAIQLNRRAFLGGAAAAVSLPFLEAMTPFSGTAHAQQMTPTRLLFYYVPNGFHMPAFTPAQTGSSYALSPTLEPLSAFQDRLLVLTNLANHPAKPDGPGDHAAGTGSFLTATHVHKTDGADIQNAISVDQIAAQELAGQTTFRSLELGIDGGGSTGGCDSGYSCAYARNISWSGPQTPMPKTVNPRIVFDRLFGGFDQQLTAEERSKRRAYQKSILDYVTDDARRLQAKLGAKDREKLEEYLTAVRQLEERIDSLDGVSGCDVPDRPQNNYGLEEKVQVMTDLMVLAFQCDLTRIQSFMFANAGSGRVYDFLGIGEGHHQISHHQSLESNYDKLKIIDHWEVQQFAYLLQRLDSIVEVDGSTLLDSSAIFFSSEISDGNRHNHTDLPVLLAGGANGYLRTGRHIRYDEEQQISDLFISMLDMVDVRVSALGDDGEGLLPDLV